MTMETIRTLTTRFAWILAAAALIAAMGGTWVSSATATAAPAATATPAAQLPPRTEPASEDEPPAHTKKAVTGKLNLNTATEDQLMMLPTVGPAKAERIVTWRRKNGGFKRTADLRRVKGFGYKTFKRLEPLLDIRGDTTLAPSLAARK
jgi:competence protein ComEA